ncbi:MAG: VOC family protein [Candidatus Micrarchaeota archaeon]|nr:VOC family protein [Candidatus Micrarchaeota archaeon]
MLNHITLKVNDFKRSRKFFTAALKPLGYSLLVKFKRRAGFGIEDIEGKRDFWIVARPNEKLSPSLTCIAFTASSKKIVNDFYRAALKAGGKTNGAPAYVKEYHRGYYAAYVLDPDGNNIEAVFDDFSKL